MTAGALNIVNISRVE